MINNNVHFSGYGSCLLSINVKDEHCSGELQKVLKITAPGQTREKLYLKNICFKLIKDEQNHIKKAVHHRNSLYYGEGKLEAGCILNQAVVLDAVNYLIHYDIQAVGEVKFANLSQKTSKKTQKASTLWPSKTMLTSYCIFLAQNTSLGALCERLSTALIK